MTPFEILALAGVVAIVVVVIYLALNREAVGSPLLAGILSIAFGAYTFVTVQREGVLPVWSNHTTNMWGVQVWYDLLLSIGIALFFVLPRARAQGMAVVPWILFVAATASIGLLAMIARLFWLERKAQPTT